ncbi:nicotinate phosphoribosyltransferase [Nostoc sp. CHAB 5834]|nr:nicotinate phosphoribosyltransferase [Nostoc sp. CHAB 5834]
MSANNPSIIRSLLETDLYKFTMWQTFLHRYPGNESTYRFVCRNTPKYPLAELLADLNEQLDMLCRLSFTEDELEYLGSLRYIKPDFVSFLRIFKFQRAFIKAWVEGDELRIEAKGPQVHVMGFEIYVLAIVNELYFRKFDQEAALLEGRKLLSEKIIKLRPLQQNGTGPGMRFAFEFFDFGIRRRFSGAWHEEVVGTLVKELPRLFRGTSNVYFAKKFGLTPIGTMAHEYLQACQASGVQLRYFQREALESWVQEYRGDLGIALTDTVGMDAFLKDFDQYFCKLFDGLRHDSGDPVLWGEKALAHYKQMRIDPATKRLVFSDGLTVEKALELYKHFASRVPVGFGIGTSLSNDVGLSPLNIVMKLVDCNGQPVAKLSDSPGKTLCEDQTFLAYLRQVFNHPG